MLSSIGKSMMILGYKPIDAFIKLRYACPFSMLLSVGGLSLLPPLFFFFRSIDEGFRV